MGDLRGCVANGVPVGMAWPGRVIRAVQDRAAVKLKVGATKYLLTSLQP